MSARHNNRTSSSHEPPSLLHTPQETTASAPPAVSVVHMEPSRKIPTEAGEILRMLNNQLEQRKQQLFQLSVQIGKESAAFESSLQAAAASVGLTPEHGAWMLDLATLEFKQTAPPPAKPNG